MKVNPPNSLFQRGEFNKIRFLPPFFKGGQGGFTLVELLTVMVVLVAIATITVKTSAPLAFQGRYEVTVDRYEKIKTAILGNPNQLINGHPSVSGFVADMGRLPNCIRELIDGQCAEPLTVVLPITTIIPSAHCSDVSYDNKADCETALATWVTGSCYNKTTGEKNLIIYEESVCLLQVPQHSWIPFVSFSAGWRGSYITISNDPAITNAFTDGWGRTAQGICDNPLYSNYDDCVANGSNFLGYCEDALHHNDYAGCILANSKWIDDNYGWYFYPFDNNATGFNNVLDLFSYGKDQSVGGLDDYDKEFPANQPIIKKNDWIYPFTFNVEIEPVAKIPNSCLLNQATCSSLGGTFIPATTTGSLSIKTIASCSIPTATDSTSCTTAKGIWSDAISMCIVQYAIDETSCKTVSGAEWKNGTGTWSAPTPASCLIASCPPSALVSSTATKQICLDLRYRNNGQIVSTLITNTIVENGIKQAIGFNLPTNFSIGQAAFKITDCATTPSTYPTPDRDFKIVDILPNRSLTFDW